MKIIVSPAKKMRSEVDGVDARSIPVFLEQSRQEEADTLSAMNRQELADYLGTERSALSREMARMKKEGLIDYCRNEIKILSEN